MPKINRNAPCPCGSGKKYKRCCLAKDSAKKNYHLYCLELVDRLRPKILEFAKKEKYSRYLPQAQDLYWQTLEEDLDPPEFDKAGFLSFMEWFIHDFIIPDQEKPVIRLFYESRPKLPEEEMKILKDWQEAHLSTHQVKEVTPGIGYLAEDIFTNEEAFIADVASSKRLNKWELITTRKIKVLDEWQISATGFINPPQDKSEIHQLIMGRFNEYQKDFPQATLSRFLRVRGYLLNHYHLTRRVKKKLPKFLTSSGEELVFQKAIYDLRDFEAAVKALDLENDFERSKWQEDEDGRLKKVDFDWLQRDKSEHMPRVGKDESGLEVMTYFIPEPGQEKYLVLGHVTLAPGRLMFEAMGDRRFELGKKRLEEVVKNLVSHRLDSTASAESKIKRSKAKRREVSEEIPAEVREALLKDFLDDHYRKWLTKPLPALDGLSPKEAVRTKEGRRQVEDLMRMMEYTHSGQKGNMAYDPSWLRNELGL